MREAATLNGDIVSELDSDNPDDYLPGGEAAVVLMKIRCKCRRDRAKAVA